MKIIKGELFFKETHLSELLELGRSQLDVQIETLMMVDSLDMTLESKKLIVQKCKEEKKLKETKKLYTELELLNIKLLK